MKYIDIQEKEKLEKFPAVAEILENKSVTSLPLVAFDGVPLWMGSLSYYYLMEELDKRGIEPVA